MSEDPVGSVGPVGDATAGVPTVSTPGLEVLRQQVEGATAAVRPVGTTSRHPVGDQPPETSLKDLVQVATRDLSLLVHKEVELAKAEATVAVKGAIKGAAGFGAAVVLALAAAIMLMFTIAETLNEFFPRPLAFLLTALLFLVLAGVGALLGRRGVQGIQKPERTLVTVKDDLAWAKHPTVVPTVTHGTGS